MKKTKAKKVSKVKTKKKAPVKKPRRLKKPAAKKTLKTKKIKALKRAYGMPETLRDAALKILDNRQAENVVTVDLTGRSSMADYLIIASGRAQRQIAAIADYLRAAFIKLGVEHIRIEGLPEANWVLIDAGDIVVHLFRPEVREYYRLEDIWNRKGR